MPILPEKETLVFPEEYSLGTITVYLAGNQEPSELLDARGTVRVPRGSKLFLMLSQHVCDDLRIIRSIPECLLANGITICERSLTSTDFRELSVLDPRSLTISRCDAVRFSQFQQLGQLRLLEHLNLEGTPVKPADFSWVCQFPNLRTLLLSGTGANGGCIPFLAALHGLEELHLVDCKVSDIDAQALWRFSRLRTVNLGMCPITDFALRGIGSSKLISLSVPNTKISDEGVEILVSEALRTGHEPHFLSLRSCQITDKALVRLASLARLAFIDLLGTRVTAQGASFLKQALPRCRILVGSGARGTAGSFSDS